MDNNQINNYDNNSGRNPNGQGNGNGNGGNNGNNQNPKKQNLLILLIAALISLLCISYFMSVITDATDQKITYNKFVEMIEANQIQSVEIKSSEIVIYPKLKEDVPVFYSTPIVTYRTGKIEDDDTLTKRLLDAGIEIGRAHV